MNKLVITLTALFLAVSVQAQTSTMVMQDGSVAKCSESEDIGNRAYRLSLTTEIDTMTLLTIESLVCQKEGSKMTWAWIDLGAEQTYNVDGQIIQKKIAQSKLQITNFEGTEEIETYELETVPAVQTIILSEKVMNESKVSAVLQNKFEISKNGSVIDVDYGYTGTYIIKLK